MNKKQFSELMNRIKLLQPKQLDSLLEAAKRVRHEPTPAKIIDTQFAVNSACPRCACDSIRKWGLESGIQRYRCNGCNRTFNALTGTPMARLRKKDLWLDYSEVLRQGLSLTKAAEHCGIDRTTAFRWRHRFLTTPKKNQPCCSGIAEADATYFLESFKGKKVHHRKSRKRGGVAQQRGLSAEQIPVLVVRDRERRTCDAVLQERAAKGVKASIERYIAPDAVLCIDGERALKKFAKTCGFAFEVLGPKQRRGRDKAFHLQNVNAYHHRLKEWMMPFRGVATKYLPNYLGLRRLHERDVNTPTAFLSEATMRIHNAQRN